jgi:hypothetical protein
VTGLLSTKSRLWRVEHHVGTNGRKYDVDHDQEKKLGYELMHGRNQIDAWIRGQISSTVHQGPRRDISSDRHPLEHESEHLQERGQVTRKRETACAVKPGVSFLSQSNEDKAMFERFYKNPLKCNGMFVEIGALDGLTLNMTLIVVAEDKLTYTELSDSVHWVTLNTSIGTDLPAHAFDYDTASFKSLVSRRPDHILRVLRLHPKVIYTDIDTIWLRDPRPFLDGDYDFWGGLDDIIDDLPYFTTGFLAFAATPNSLKLLQNWRISLEQKRQLNQPVFNDLVKIQQVSSFNLPRREFPSGNLFFDRNLYRRDIQKNPTLQRHIFLGSQGSLEMELFIWGSNGNRPSEIHFRSLAE